MRMESVTQSHMLIDEHLGNSLIKRAMGTRRLTVRRESRHIVH